MYDDDPAVKRALATHRINRAVEHLMGIVDGLIADGHLHDMEVKFLRTWLSDNEHAQESWPGSLVYRKVSEVLADGIVTEEERKHLHETLAGLLGNDFSLTGSVSSEVSALPIEDTVTVQLRNAGVCHTGAFLFGTRAACERATMRAGGMALDNVSKGVEYLVIGTRVSRDWAHTSFGRKIQKAVSLQQEGHAIEIISEARWVQALGAP